MSTAKERIEAFAKRQHEWHYPCPRCGRDVMDEEPARNAMSRRVNVQVCDDCGTLEAFEDMPGGFQAPLEVWAIMKYPPRWGMPLQLAFVGRDSWSRPVYECGGKYYVDTDPRAGRRIAVSAMPTRTRRSPATSRSSFSRLLIPYRGRGRSGRTAGQPAHG